MEWLADRFFRSNGTWVDAASGAHVRILLEPASDVDALDWEEQCARLSRGRHPALNPLLDYGPVAQGQRFEAYARLPALPGGRSHRAGQEHAARFLRSAGITMEGSPRCLCDARGDKPARIVVAGARSYAAAATCAGRSSGSTRRPGRSVDGNDGCRANRGWPSHRTNVCRAIGAPRGLHSCLPRGSGETLQRLG